MKADEFFPIKYSMPDDTRLRAVARQIEQPWQLVVGLWVVLLSELYKHNGVMDFKNIPLQDEVIEKINIYNRNPLFPFDFLLACTEQGLLNYKQMEDFVVQNDGVIKQLEYKEQMRDLSKMANEVRWSK